MGVVSRSLAAGIAAAVLALAPATAADRIGQVKVVSGEASIERGGARSAAEAGAALCEGDRVETGADSAIGMTFTDNSRMSLGPNSSLVLENYAFNRPGRQNGFDARLARGSLSAASGEIVKARPLAMRVLTPTTVLGVKGTEFVVRVGEGG
jgi:hypothetical protein